MRRAIPYPCSGPRTSRVLRTINASVPWRTSVFCFIVLTMHRHFGFQQEGWHTSFGKTTGQCRACPCDRIAENDAWMIENLLEFSSGFSWFIRSKICLSADIDRVEGAKQARDTAMWDTHFVRLRNL